MHWPWISRALYTNVLRQLAVEKRRAIRAEEALQLEHHENRVAERHWANQMLRKMNSFPLADKSRTVQPAEPAQQKPVYDAGELAALEAEAERLGLKREDARRFFAREKNIPEDLIM